MIIACPACKTRYVVPDSAIGVEGRTVRCAKCKHSWFQDGPELEAPAKPADEVADPVSAAPPEATPPTPEAEPAPTPEAGPAAPDESEPAAEAGPTPKPSVSHWRTPAGAREAARAAVAQRVVEEPSPEPPAPPSYEQPPQPAAESAPEPEPAFYGQDEDDASQFDYEPPFRPRRNPLKLWTAAAMVFAALALGTAVGVSYWGMPDWVPVTRPTFGVNQPNLRLEFPPGQQDRRTLPNGTEYFGASGTVTNIGRETVAVPPIRIVLRDERDRIVYDWSIVPPKPELAPGETVAIKEAVTDIPRAAKFAEIGWKPK
ncbi:MJ0042-type zinc finger domain-containing protein [Altererythrobacter sp.]|uniref:MJ0042-type zinc finger domain-containing protein n=1 Tax=Altererythrobacter sp. TaxID=1872480 RepID=UPI003D0D98C2